MKYRKHALLVGAVLGSSPAPSVAETLVLPETTVVANRLETPLEHVGSAFSYLEASRLREQGLYTLEDALRLVPGSVIGSEGGQRGSITAARLRGGEADQTLILVDGMRVTDANVTPFNFLGNESLVGFSRVSVLRGPQSALYGSEAIGGVIALDTQVGSREGPQRVYVEGGSFGSLRGGAEFQGEWSGVRWFVAGSHDFTNNDRDNNDYWQNQWASRAEVDLGPDTQAGVTARMWMSEYENPGSLPSFGVAVDERDAYLATAYVDHTFNARLRSRLTAGYYREEFEERGAFPFESEAEKISIDLRNVVGWSDQHETVLGALAEWTAFRSTATPVDEEGWLTGVYANHVWRPLDALTLTVGGRLEHHDRWEDTATWRATGSWQTPLEAVRLHGSYGTGYRAPSYFELYGAIPQFNFMGNPNLDAEESQGWDFGVETTLGTVAVVDVTWFRNEIDNLIDFTPANIGEALIQGIEVSAEGTLCDERIRWRGAYTWMEATDETTGRRLTRRPRHALSVDLQAEAREGLTVGIGGTITSGHDDFDFSSFPAAQVKLKERLLLRAYTRYEVNENVSLNARAENILDREYEDVLGFPGSGIGFFGGAEVRW